MIPGAAEAARFISLSRGRKAAPDNSVGLYPQKFYSLCPIFIIECVYIYAALKRGEPMTDEELIELINESPSKGLEKTIELYSALVFRIVSATLVPVGTNEDAQECASDVFVLFYRNIESLDLNKGTVKGYLAVAAKHHAISVLRKLKARSNGNVISLDENENLFSVSEDIEKNERSRIVKQAIEALGEPDSTIVVRRYLFGETAKEIAKDLKMTHEAVMKRSSRAKKKLKELLGGVLCG